MDRYWSSKLAGFIADILEEVRFVDVFGFVVVASSPGVSNPFTLYMGWDGD